MLTIALGVGANAALFGVIDAVLIQPLPFRDPGKLVRIWETHPALPQLQVTAPDFRDWRSQSRSFASMAAHTLSAMNQATLLGQGEPEIVHGTMASSDLFSTMGIEPMLGRTFSAAEERARQRVAVISEKLWRGKFAADPRIAGKQMRIDKQLFTVVGVVPQRQAFPEWADFWMPLSLMESDLQNSRKYHPLEVAARLRPGVSVEEAQTEIQGIARRLAQTYPATNASVGSFVISLSREMTRAIRPSLLLAWAAVGLVLLMACANLAHLFLARMAERREEMAIREMLGAGWGVVVRQVLAESLALAFIGGAAGIALALGVSRVLPGERMAWQAPVWLYSTAITVVTGVLFGLPACWHLLRDRSRLTASSRTVVYGRSRVGTVLLAGEVAMAFLVLAGAALLARNFAALLDEPAGFEAAHVMEVPNLPAAGEWDQILLTLRRLPGVRDAAAVNSAPMSLGASEHSRFATRFGIEGRVFDKGSFPVAQIRWSTPDYLQTLGIPLRRGRWLTDSKADQTRVLINETLAKRFFPERDAVGQRLILGVLDPQRTSLDIAGVVGDVREFGLDQDVEPMFYSISTGPVMTLVIKTVGDPMRLAPAVRAAIQAVDPEIPISGMEPLERNVAESLARRRFALQLLGIFGVLAALFTAAGIYGVLAYSVSTRVREFGVRGAVGASRRHLTMMIIREAAVLVAPGLAAGGILAFTFSSVMRRFVYGLSPLDPLSLTSAGAAVILLTMFSAWIPALRAAAVDPATALRNGS